MAHIFQLPLPSKHFCPGRIISPDSTIDEVSLLYTSLLLFGSRPILKPSSCCCRAVVLLLCEFTYPRLVLVRKPGFLIRASVRPPRHSFRESFAEKCVIQCNFLLHTKALLLLLLFGFQFCENAVLHAEWRGLDGSGNFIKNENRWQRGEQTMNPLSS